jgi:ribose transport system permease protein
MDTEVSNFNKLSSRRREPSEQQLAPRSFLRSLLNPRTLFVDNGILIVLVALFITLAASSSAFATERNLLNLLQQNAAVGIISCAATIVIIAGGFDLSVGAIYVVGGVISAWLAVHVSVPVGLLSGIACGAVLGAINGVLATRLRISSFLATLATSLVFSGSAVAITKGFPIAVSDPSYGTLGSGSVGSVPYPVLFFVGAAALLQLMLSQSVLGRYIFAVGGNKEAARNSGVRVDLVVFTTFVVAGVAASLGGVLDASTVATGSTDVGAELALTSIAAVALGGTSIFGGVGSVWRTVAGVVVLAMIGNGFDILGLAAYYKDIVEGAIIVVAVASNSLAARNLARP